MIISALVKKGVIKICPEICSECRPKIIFRLTLSSVAKQFKKSSRKTPQQSAAAHQAQGRGSEARPGSAQLKSEGETQPELSAYLQAPSATPEAFSSSQGKSDEVAQRFVTVSGTTYPGAYYSVRDFRKEVMFALKNNDFKELGGKAMWQKLDEWLQDDNDHPFDNWPAMVNQLWDMGLLVRNQRIVSMGPKNLGKRPNWRKETTDTVTIKSGEHRRHVISSSTLGLGIEKAHVELKKMEADADVRLQALNAWLERNGQDTGYTSEYSALRAIWDTVHNHVGNLWPGDGQFNSAIGFLRPSFKDLLPELEGDDEIEMDTLIEKLGEIKPQMKNLAGAWNEIIQVLKDSVRMADPEISDIGFGAAMIHWVDEIRAIEGDSYALFDPVYRQLDTRLDFSRRRRIPVRIVLDILNETLDKRKFLEYKKYKPIYSKWLISYGLPPDKIKKYKAKELVEDWLFNCDVDFPIGQVADEKKDNYAKELFSIYNIISNPDATLFGDGKALDRFMKLSYQAD